MHRQSRKSNSSSGGILARVRIKAPLAHKEHTPSPQNEIAVGGRILKPHSRSSSGWRQNPVEYALTRSSDCLRRHSRHEGSGNRYRSAPIKIGTEFGSSINKTLPKGV